MKFKKVYLIALLFIGIVLSIPKYEFAATDGDWEYEVSDSNEVTITRYNGSDTEIIIPSTLDNKNVIKIGDGAFSECETITSITVSNNIKSIGVDAFEYCKNLQNVTLNDGLLEIGTWAFHDCTSLKSIDIPNTVTKLSTDAEILYNMGYLEDGYENITYPAIFDGCTNLVSVTLPENITEIGFAMFRNCESLNEVNIPDNVEKIGYAAFYNCSSLTSIDIPDIVTLIDDCAFYNCSSLTSINIPDIVTSIGDYTFYECRGLTSIDIPDTVTSIGEYAFFCCEGLTSIDSLKNLEKIGEAAFWGCGITQVTIPASVQEIGASAFAWCNLKKIDVEIGNKNYISENGVLFDINKTKLIQYNIASDNKRYAIPDGVKIIGEGSFIGAKNLEVLEVPNSITEILGGPGGAGGPLEDYAFGWNNKYNSEYEVFYDGAEHELKNIKYEAYYGDIIGLHVWKNVHYNSITDAEKSSIENSYEYTSNEIKPSITLETWKGKLIEGTDYKITYKDNINVGNAVLTIVGIGEHEGEEFITTFDITAKSIENFTIEGLEDETYTGNSIEPNITIKDGDITLAKGKDYEVDYENNINIGKATIKIKGKGNYTGEIIKTFKITAKGISKAEVTGIKDEAYTGKAVIQNIVVKLDGVELKNGTDYTVEYQNNTNAGTATVVIKGKGNYTGEITKTFKITAKDMSKAAVSGIKNQKYTGQPLTQNIIVRVDGTGLRNGIDYIVEYKNNAKPGKATVTIKGIGSYIGQITKTFIITPKKVSELKVKEQTTKSIKLNWSKHEGVTGYKVYSYNYKKSKWEYVGKTSSTSYTIKKLKNGTTYKYRVRAYKTIDGKQYFGEYSSNIKTSTKTKTPSIIELTTKNKKVTLEWKKISGASGYEIYMAKSKKGKYSKIKTIKNGKTTDYTKSKLKKNKKYYFKIRTYRTVDGKKIYSSYSSVKSIKVK